LCRLLETSRAAMTASSRIVAVHRTRGRAEMEARSLT